MRAELLAAAVLAALLAAPSSAHDEGHSVTFSSEEEARFAVDGLGVGHKIVYDSGESDPIPGAWDTVLIQGVSPDPAVGFEAARPSVVAPDQWQPLQAHRFPGGRFWAKARFPKGQGTLKLRAFDAGSRSAHVVDVYGVQVFAADPAPAGSPAVPPRGPQDPAAARPPVHGRAEWGAKPPTEPWSPDPLPWRVTLHHSDGRRTTTLADSEAEARFIQDFHVHGRGWIDIAYHFLVDASGDILEGRPEGVLGAHTLGNNEGNIGIVLLGTYHPPVNDVPTKAQLEAVAALGRYLVKRYGIDPDSLKGHRDYKQTDCPGNLAYTKLDALRLAFSGLPLPSAAVAKRLARKPSVPLALTGRPDFDGRGAAR